jgi:hypothetical protein
LSVHTDTLALTAGLAPALLPIVSHQPTACPNQGRLSFT